MVYNITLSSSSTTAAVIYELHSENHSEINTLC